MTDQNQALEFATDLARRSGATLLEHFHSGELHPDLKADRSVVTLADTASDTMIAAAIKNAYPQDVLLSEELNPHLQPGEPGRQSPTVWIIDPLDGTTNFALGLHFWGVLIARVRQGQPDISVMYFPLLDEMYTAQRGQGAYLNGGRLRIRPPSELSPLSFFACCSRTYRRYHVSIPYKARILGSTAYTLCTVARSIAVIGFEATPKIWDLAAPWLLVEEAGGFISTYDGARPFPLDSTIDYSRQSFPVLAAANPTLGEQAFRQISPREAPPGRKTSPL